MSPERSIVHQPLPRRAALAGAFGGCLAYLALKACAASAAPGPLFLVCRVHPSEGAGAVRVDGEGQAAAVAGLPGRGHGICLRPGTAEAVVFARRPGTFAAVFEPLTGLVHRRFDTPASRHFFGHGAFDAAGRLLFATENDVASGEGMLGIYDAADGYRRVGEVPSGGIGPHDVTLFPDGRTLAVANGGILTRPETGRTMLNLDSMRSGLAYLDLANGRPLAEDRLAEDLRLLSLRHLAVAADGRRVVGMQWEGDPDDLVPLVALGDGGGLRALSAPEAEMAAMASYVGSVAFDQGGGVVAASCPRGNRLAFWDADGSFLRTVALPDACAIGPARAPGRFLTTTGIGTVLEVDARTGATVPLGERAPVAYDNHLTVL